MSDATEALQRAKMAAAQRRLVFTRHAMDQASARGASAFDVAQAIGTATVAVADPPGDKWRIEGGRDIDGDVLTVVLVFSGYSDARVVTLF